LLIIAELAMLSNGVHRWAGRISGWIMRTPMTAHWRVVTRFELGSNGALEFHTVPAKESANASAGDSATNSPVA
jgi:hypothetical protein